MENKINLRNIVNAIDKTVLKLKKAKLSSQTLNKKLAEEVEEILLIISDEKTEVYSDEAYKNAIYGKREELEIFYHDLEEIGVTKNEIASLIKEIPKIKGTNTERINSIQSLLLKASISISKSRQILIND